MPIVRFRVPGGDKEVACDVAQGNSSTLRPVLLAALPALGLAQEDALGVISAKHRGKTVDLDLPWRLTGLVNNSVLDVIVLDAIAPAVVTGPVRPTQPAPSMHSTESVPLAASSSTTPTLSISQTLSEFRAQVWDADAKVAVPTLLKIIQNIVSQPLEERFRALRLNNPAFRQKLANSNAALQVLRAIGFKDEIKQDQAHLVLASYEESSERLKEAHQFLVAYARELGLAQADLAFPSRSAAPGHRLEAAAAVPAAAAPLPNPGFDVFRVSVMSSQPRPGIEASPVEMRLASLKNRQEELLKATLNVQRAALALRPGSQFNPRRFARALHRPAEQDSDGEEDASRDLSAISQHQKEVQEKLKKQENFQTKAMRQVDELSRARIFPYCIIRVLFPDRSILQAKFSPLETIRDVLNLIAQSCGLEEAQGFYLLCGPPPQRLSPDQVLHQSGFMPSAVFQVVGVDLRVKEELFTANEEDLLVDMPVGVPLVPKEEKPGKAEKGKPKWLKI